MINIVIIVYSEDLEYLLYVNSLLGIYVISIGELSLH